MSSALFKIACCLLGKTMEDIFVVNIDPSDCIYDLQEAIKAECDDDERIKNCQASLIKLWKVSIPTTPNSKWKEEIMRYKLNNEERLLATSRISEIFEEAPPLCFIHIIVKPERASDDENSNVEDLLYQRSQWYGTSNFPSPSEHGKATEFVKSQQGDNFFYCSRPETREYNVPLALLDPLFGAFTGDCSNVKLEAKDMNIALELKTTMSEFYPAEHDRRDEFNRILQSYGIPIQAFTTNGHVENNGRPSLINEARLEISGNVDAEPSLQALCRYDLFLRNNEAWKDVTSCHPCFITFIAGPHIGFGGCALTSRPTMEIFALLPLSFHEMNYAAFDAVARHLSALKSAVNALADRYQKPSPEIPLINQRSFFPYPNSFTYNGEVVNFSYDEKRTDGRLLFYATAELEPGRKTPVCVKFVRQYGRAVHDWCASREHAPHLYGYESYPGGWFMVVMERLDENFWVLLADYRGDRQKLKSSIRAHVESLGQNNLVHGDIRSINIMVGRFDETKFMLLDFNWAGKINKVQYPRFINMDPRLNRPHDVAAFRNIVPAHDLHMVDRLC